MIRTEAVFSTCTDFIFSHYDAKLQALSVLIGDDVALDGFAKKEKHGLITFNQDRYPILVIEPDETDPRLLGGGRSGGLVHAYLKVQILGENDDSTTTKIQRYADALLNVLNDDHTLGGNCTKCDIGPIKYGTGGEGQQEFALFFTKLTFQV